MSVHLHDLVLPLLLVSAVSHAQPPTLLARLHQTTPMVCAHRGRLDESRPENSLVEMQRTFDAGIRMMEVDLVESKDHVVFLLHDDTLDRTTDATGTPASHTAEELRRVRLRRPDGGLTTEALPEFEALLAWAERSGAYLMLDIKHTPPQTAATLVARHHMERQVLILTFDEGTAADAMAATPALPVSVLVKTPVEVDVHRSPRSLFYVSAAAAAAGVGLYAACAGPVITDSMGAADEAALAKNGVPYGELFGTQHVRVLVTNHPGLAQSRVPATAAPLVCGSH